MKLAQRDVALRKNCDSALRIFYCFQILSQEIRFQDGKALNRLIGIPQIWNGQPHSHNKKETRMDGIMVPIVLFIGLFTFLSISAIANAVSDSVRYRSNLQFMQSLIDRGFSASEIERMMIACRSGNGKSKGNKQPLGDFPESCLSNTTQPVPPVKPKVYS